MSQQKVKAGKILKVQTDAQLLAQSTIEKEDLMAVEQPLEIRISYTNIFGMVEKSISITMRTPANDFELALGFLFTEGVVSTYQQVKSIRYCTDSGRQNEQGNIVKVTLLPEATVDLDRLQRNFYTTSSCGICGKASIDAISQTTCYPLPAQLATVSAATIHLLSTKINAEQTVFSFTGGIHAAALFDSEGNLQALREDVGRHNALDKLIGAMLAKGTMPLHNALLWVSGRASFELVQKAVMAGIPIMVAVGAPSSLAVSLAERAGMTLIGFARNQSFNIYCGAERISL